MVLLLMACANVSAPREQSALPAAPNYAPTLAPARTPVPPGFMPTLVRPTLATKTDKFNSVIPTVRPRLNTPTAIARLTPKRDMNALKEYQRGIAYVAVTRDEYQSEKSKQALDELFATGANYISILVTWYQDDVTSLKIAQTKTTPSDEDLKFVIDYAHAHGVKVLLKPQVDFNHDLDHWRGQIFFDDEADWQAWFASYRNFILHYAKFAQSTGVEEFAVGTELLATSTRTADWRAIIRAVRQQYTGLLTYCANHSGEETQVQFWNDLDFIGVNVFYHITNYRTPTMEQIREGWTLPARQLSNVHENFPKQPIVFTEVGYPSMDLASVWPWNWQRLGAVDYQEQAMLYEGLFETWWYHPDREWFRGMFIWNWRADPNQGGLDDINYTPHGKPAEDILKFYYQMDAPPTVKQNE